MNTTPNPKTMEIVSSARCSRCGGIVYMQLNIYGSVMKYLLPNVPGHTYDPMPVPKKRQAPMFPNF